METGSSVILDTCGDDSVLLQTVKNIVNQNQHELETEEEEFFLVTDVENEHHRSIDVTNEDSVCNLNESLEKISWSGLCRICANVNDHLIPIFEGEGMEHALCNKIHKYLPIQISEDDTLPLQLCYHCAATLLAWHELAEGCLSAERRLLEIQTSSQNKQYFEPQSADESETPPETTISNITEKDFTSQEIEVKNESYEKEAANDTSRSSSNRTPFKMFLEMHNMFWKPYKKRCQLQQKKSNMGGDCGSIWIAVMDTTLEHPSIADLQQNNDTEVKEEICEEYKQNNAKILDREQNTCMVEYLPNVNDESQKTKICKTSLSVTKDTNEHIKKQKNLSDTQESYQCIECGKFFKLKDSYLRHMRIHKDERPFTCHVCGKQFRDSGGLSRHLKDVHAKLKNFMCDICGKSFASKATRDDHRRTHTGERPYICDSCGKTFKSKASLYIHSKLHTNEFPHPCTYCNKKFRRRQEMLAHVTTHTGEKNYGCDICSKRFRVKSELVRHKLVHSETKPFVCVKCGLAFRQKRYLNNHIKSRHVDLIQMG